MIYTSNIIINQKENDYINSILIEPETENNWTGSGWLYGYSVRFENDYIMDIDIIGTDRYESGTSNKPFTQAALFDQFGIKLRCTDANDNLIGNWDIEYNNDKYIVNIIVEN